MIDEQESGRRHMMAANLVREWMSEYQRYLVDGDPNTVHPKARAALTLRIADMIEIENTLAIAALSKVAEPRKKSGDARNKTAKVSVADVDIID